MTNRHASSIDRPCAAHGFTSYRYKTVTGWIMIGAKDDTDALREALRSTSPITPERLQVWNGSEYVAANCCKEQ